MSSNVAGPLPGLAGAVAECTGVGPGLGSGFCIDGAGDCICAGGAVPTLAGPGPGGWLRA